MNATHGAVKLTRGRGDMILRAGRAWNGALFGNPLCSAHAADWETMAGACSWASSSLPIPHTGQTNAEKLTPAMSASLLGEAHRSLPRGGTEGQQFCTAELGHGAWSRAGWWWLKHRATCTARTLLSGISVMSVTVSSTPLNTSFDTS